MDLAHESDQKFSRATSQLVSILVLMDLAHEYAVQRAIREYTNVSILVLMDLAHEYRVLLRFSQAHWFQSLF